MTLIIGIWILIYLCLSILEKYHKKKISKQYDDHIKIYEEKVSDIKTYFIEDKKKRFYNFQLVLSTIEDITDLAVSSWYHIHRHFLVDVFEYFEGTSDKLSYSYLTNSCLFGSAYNLSLSTNNDNDEKYLILHLECEGFNKDFFLKLITSHEKEQITFQLFNDNHELISESILDKYHSIKNESLSKKDEKIWLSYISQLNIPYFT